MANINRPAANPVIVRPKANTVVPTAVQKETKSSPDNIAVRAYLTNAGLDNDGITYQDGKVYYGGRSLTPLENRNGTTYASREALDSFIKDVYGDSGLVPIRDTFSKNGLDTSQLGYQNGKVTYGGEVYTPKINANGITYGDEGGVTDFMRRAAGTTQNPFVRINSYKNKYGISDLNWDANGKKVLIGGKEVPYSFIDDSGNAWALKSVMDSVYDEIAKENGIVSWEDILEKMNESARLYNNDLQEIKNREFDFTENDLRNDAVWRAYAAMYDDAAEKAYKDTLSKAAARTGGQISTMAITAAEEARNRLIKEKMSIIPTIAEMAYKRYGDSVNKDMEAIKQKYASQNESLIKGAELSQLALDSINRQKEAEENRVLKNKENEQYNEDRSYAMAELLNIPIPKDIAIKYDIQPKADGTYPTPNEIEISKRKQIWEEYDKLIFDYQSQSALNDWYAKQALK